MRDLNLLFKRTVDIIVSILGLLVLCIPFCIIAILIKCNSKGPVFFFQNRIGMQGRVFCIVKFRTMVVNAENNGDGLFVYENSDSRITAIGRILRQTSIDELPQLFNILKGDMSLVGPRPPVTYFPYKGYDEYPEWAKKRFNVRPGITGLAQVRTRTTAPWDERIIIDNEYVDNISILADMKIIFATITSVLTNKNIYPESKEQINNLRSKNESENCDVYKEIKE